MARRDIAQEITDKMINAIENGEVNGKWQRPWSIAGFDQYPHNVITGKRYRGMNVLLLMIAGGGTFGTYKQWQSIGARIRKGEKSTMILAPIICENKDTGEDELKGWRGVALFSSTQVDGYEPEGVPTEASFDPHTAAEEAIKASGATITFGSDRAFYAPGPDSIVVPAMAQFDTAEEYYGTMLHELVHWTGHKSRLERDFSGRFGSDSYAFEELVAELGSSFLCSMLGIHHGFREDHAKYLKHWLGVLKGDKNAIMTAASHAQKAADYIMDAVEAQEEDDAVAA